MGRLMISLIFLTVIACHWQNEKITTQSTGNRGLPKLVADIPLPPGYKRVELPSHSFGAWLRNVSLKNDNHVYLYNGSLKADQTVQFAVLDMRVGNKDLQQCADAIMRLRAEYFFRENRPDLIAFKATDGTVLSFSDWKKGTRYRLAGNKLVAYKQNNMDTSSARKELESFLETVFGFCGTLSLSGELRSKDIADIFPGDVFVKGGSPGHAMIVMDVAVNDSGRKIFNLAQSYMPAQDIHIVKNQSDERFSPWYPLDNSMEIVTPEWTFGKDQLKTW